MMFIEIMEGYSKNHGYVLMHLVGGRQAFQALSQNCEKRRNISFVVSVHPYVRLLVHTEQIGSHWTIFRKFCILVFFEDLSRKFKFYSSMTRISFNSRDDFVYTYDISLNSSQNEKCFREQLQRKLEHSSILFNMNHRNAHSSICKPAYINALKIYHTKTACTNCLLYDERMRFETRRRC